jgi:spore maturation protein SpmA
MLNYIWLGLILAAVVLGGCDGKLKELTDAAFDAAKTAVMTIALPLAGLMALWLGIMRLAEKSGLVILLAQFLRPVMRRLFPDVPEQHPAMGSMLMNIAANMLGLANAATPLGLRAMNDLEKLNPHPGTATNAMCTFLAINTSSVQLLPITAISIVAAAGSKNPTAIVGTSLIATVCSTAAGIAAVKFLQNLPAFQVASPPNKPAGIPFTRPSGTLFPSEGERHGVRGPIRAEAKSEAVDLIRAPASTPFEPRHLPWWGKLSLAAFIVLFGWLLWRNATSGQGPQNPFVNWINSLSVVSIPFLLSFFPLYAGLRGVKVYEEFVEGAKEGFQIALRIIPFLVAILVAVGMFRAGGGIDLLTRWLSPVLEAVRFPPELLPMVLMRPLSGSGTTGLFTDLVKNLGPDHLITRMGGTIFGSTETTFYVIAVYFGAVSVRRTRHAVAAGLLADLAGVIASIAICRMVF